MIYDLEVIARIMRSSIVVTLLLSLFLVIQVFFAHRKAYQLAPRVNGLLPTYTATMSSGVFVLEAALGWAIIEALRVEGADLITGQTIARLCLYMTGSFLILAGLMILRKTEKRRIDAAIEARQIIRRLDEE